MKEPISAIVVQRTSWCWWLLYTQRLLRVVQSKSDSNPDYNGMPFYQISELPALITVVEFMQYIVLVSRRLLETNESCYPLYFTLESLNNFR